MTYSDEVFCRNDFLLELLKNCLRLLHEDAAGQWTQSQSNEGDYRAATVTERRRARRGFVCVRLQDISVPAHVVVGEIERSLTTEAVLYLSERRIVIPGERSFQVTPVEPSKFQ